MMNNDPLQPGTPLPPAPPEQRLSPQNPAPEQGAPLPPPSAAPGQNPPPAQPRQENAFLHFLKRLGKKITHQWGLKLVCLILAICLWGGLITQDSTLPRDKVFNDVKVNVVGAADLQSSGFIVVGGLDQVETVRIKAQVPQRNYASATANRYTVRLDLTQIKAAGEQTVKLTATSTSSSLYGSVTEISVPQITVLVEECVSKHNVPVEIRVTGQAPEGYYAYPATSDPVRVDITGPKSVVDAVSRCVVTLNLSDLTLPEDAQIAAQPLKTALDFTFEDLSGQPLDQTYLTVRSQNVALQSVTVNQQFYPILTASISQENLLTGKPKEGYEVKRVTIDPETIQIAAVNPEVFSDDKVFYLSGQLDIGGASETVTGTLSITRRGGSGNVVYMSEYEVHVVAEIGPVDGPKPETEQAE